MWIKKWGTLIAVATLLAGVLAGCSSSDSNADQDGITTLTVWGMGAEAKALPEMAAQFEQENPDIRVEVQALPWANAHDKLLTAVGSKSGPDIVQMGTSWVPEFAHAGSAGYYPLRPDLS